MKNLLLLLVLSIGISATLWSGFPFSKDFNFTKIKSLENEPAIIETYNTTCPSSSQLTVSNISYSCVGTTLYNINFTISGAPTTCPFGNFEGYTIDAGAYFVMDCGTTPIPGMCFLNWDPVCACNGVTYTNQDCADKAGYPTIFFNGECTGTEEVVFDIFGVPEGQSLTVEITLTYGGVPCPSISYTFDGTSCAACPTGNTVTVTNTNDSGSGSLREAIECANADAALDNIEFDISGSPPHLINLNSELPTIVDDNVVIDGTTQPNWSMGDIILDGSNNNSLNSLVSATGIDGFEIHGLVIRNNDQSSGLGMVTCTNFKVGDANKGNVFYSNAESASGIGAVQVVIQECLNGNIKGNIFGVTENYSLPSGNITQVTALGIEGNAIQVGGFHSLNESNVFGHCATGIHFWDYNNFFTPGSNDIMGNYFGASPNDDDIALETALLLDYGFNLIGLDADSYNVIKNNQTGVQINNDSDVMILQNQFSCNTSAIVNNISGPIINSASSQAVSGTSDPNAEIEVFLHNQGACSSFVCQGETFVGSTTADGNGNWSLDNLSLNAGSEVTATATSNLKTSGFSACATVQDCNSLSVQISPDPANGCPGGFLELDAGSGFSQYAWSNGDDTQTSFVFSAGTYIVTVTDGNGCTATDDIQVEFEDIEVPLAVCQTAITVNIELGGSVTILASAFDNGSTDNCSNNLVFSFSPDDPTDVSRTFDCDDLGPWGMLVYAYDESNNYDDCWTPLTVADDDQNCQSCVISNLTAVSTNCNGSFFDVIIDFDFENVSSVFDIIGNGNNYGTFTYGDLPVTIGPILDDGQPKDFTVRDDGISICSASIDLEPPFCAPNDDCTHPDYYALVALYEATDGSNWNNTWDTTDCDVCTWFGVECDVNDRVEIINLGDNNLIGTLPDLNFPFLLELRLPNNALSDTIPNFSGIPTVTLIDIGFNFLSGSIPDFTNIPLIEVLLVRNNLLSDTIPNFSNTPNLEHLSCGDNQLTGEIPDFSNIINLTGLIFWDNEISGNIPVIPSLTSLGCHNNNLSGCFPSYICDLGLFGATGNPELPWEGDHTNFCLGEPQIGAPCNDGNPNTTGEVIGIDCNCALACDALIAYIIVTNTSCGQDNGSASVIVNNGSGNYSSLWSTGDTTETIADLAMGTYEVTVIDGACEVMASGIVSFEEEPVIEWERSYGGSKNDEANEIQQNPDGSYILAGESNSDDFDVGGNHGNDNYRDVWVTKLDSSGNLIWEVNLGGSWIDFAKSIKPTIDGGYILVGYILSDDGDITGYKGNGDFWVVKLNSNGAIEWEKSLGGSLQDYPNDLQVTIDGGFIIAGYSQSTDGDVSGNYGNANPAYWIVKLDSVGNIVWENTYGSTGNDQATSVKQTADEGYIVAGFSTSDTGDATSNNGGFDFWIIKLDNIGTLIWEKNFGGSQSDKAYSIQQTNDDGYIVTGTTRSNDFDVSGGNNGQEDYWVVKLNSQGDLEWENTFGGSNPDKPNSVVQSIDGNYIIVGESFSNDGDVGGNNGSGDFWMIVLDQSGEMIRSLNFGGSSYDKANSVIIGNDGKIVMAGFSFSDDIDVNNNNGSQDFWILKLGPPHFPQTQLPNDTLICQNNPLQLSPYDSLCTTCTYLWDDGNTDSIRTVNPLQATTYTVTLTDENGCTDSDTITINIASPTLSLGNDTTYCSDEVLKIEAGNWASYLWHSGLTGSFHPAPASGIYAVTVTDVDGCTASDSIEVVREFSTEYFWSAEICEGESYEIGDSTFTNPGSYEVILDGGNFCDSLINLELTIRDRDTIHLYNQTCNLNEIGNTQQNINNPSSCDSTIVTYTSLQHPVSPDSLLLHFPLGGDALDYGGGDHHATPNGPTFIEDRFGIPEKALQFDGTDDYLELVTGGNVHNDFNLSFWMRLEEDVCGGEEQTLFQKGVICQDGEPGEPGNAYWFDIFSDGTDCNVLTGTLYEPNGGVAEDFASFNTTEPLESGKLYFVSICYVQASRTFTLYLNGELASIDHFYKTGFPNLQDIDPQEFTQIHQTTSTLKIGGAESWCNFQNTYTAFFNGTLDEIRLYDRSLGFDEMMLLFEETSKMAMVDTTICFGESLTIGNSVYSQSGNYTDLFPHSYGCDSVVMTNLNVIQLNPTLGNDTTICDTENIALNAFDPNCQNCTYLWDDDSTNPVRTDVPSQNTIYWVSLEDERGCTYTDSIEVSVQKPSVNLGMDTTICQDNYLLQAGDATNFDWSNGATSSNILIDETDEYSVTITDGLGCQASDTVQITISELSLSVIETDVDCNGGNSGSISAQGINGTSPYTYSIDGINFQSNSIFSPLTAQDYEVIVLDADGCTDTIQSTISEPTALMGNAFQTVLGCEGESNNEAIATISGGTPGYTFLWGNGETDSIATNLDPGQTFVSITDSNGCFLYQSLTINELPIIAAVLMDTFCENDTILINGTQYHAGNASGIEIFDDQASNGCDSVLTVDLSFTNMVIDEDLTPTLCPGESIVINGMTYDEDNPTGQQLVEPVSGMGCDTLFHIDLQFHPPAEGNISDFFCFGEFYEFEDTVFTQPGEHVLLLESIHGCDSVLTINLDEFGFETDMVQAVICKGEAYEYQDSIFTDPGIYRDTILGYTGCDSLIWELDLSILEQPDFVLNEDFYDFPVDENKLDLLITQNDEIPDTALWFLQIITEPKVDATLDILNKETIEFKLHDQNFVGLDTFYYALCDLNCPEACDTAMVVIRFENTCISKATKLIPYAFSPGKKDGVNDFFDPLKIIEDAGCPVNRDQTRFTVFNRWGEAVFAPKAYPENGWDGGQGNGDKEKLPQGAYYYVLTFPLEDEEIELVKPLNLLY